MTWQPIASARPVEKRRGQKIYPAKERIARLSIADPATECWNWQGQVSSIDKPYGRLVVGSRTDGSRRTVGAHRYSFETFKGPIPAGEWCVCHSCDNPRCVNPDHLWLGTKKDNADDRDAKGRNKPAPILYGDAAPGAKLTNAQVVEIRAAMESSSIIAARYGVSSGHIRSIKRGNHFPAPPEGSE